MGYVKRVSGSGSLGTPGAPPTDPLFGERYPALFEYLTLIRWEDGRARETSTLLALTEDGKWKLCLNDRALDRSAWCSGATLDEALEALEAALAADEAEWRRRAPGGPKGKPGK